MMSNGPVVVGVILIMVLLMGGFESCDSGKNDRRVYSQAQDSGRLQAENVRLQEAQLQAAKSLTLERHRSAQLVDEIGTRQHVEALMVGVVLLGGCAMAVTLFALARRRRVPS
jgi:hypothetical protein